MHASMLLLFLSVMFTAVNAQSSEPPPKAVSDRRPATHQSEWRKVIDKLENHVPPPADADPPCYPFSKEQGCLPAGWEKKHTSHAPMIELSHDGRSVTVGVSHGVAHDHFVGLIYLRGWRQEDDSDHEILHLEEFSGTHEGGVEFTVEMPSGFAGLRAFAYCNKHGLWASDTFSPPKHKEL